MMAEPLQPGYENQPAVYDTPAHESTTVVVAQPSHRAVRITEFKDYPVPALCNRCHQEGITDIRFQDGSCTYITTLITCFFLPMGCAIIPYMMDTFKDVVHTCPHCANLMTIYKR